MKLAWLVKDYDDTKWSIVFEEPDGRYAEVLPIVYEVVDAGPPP